MLAKRGSADNKAARTEKGLATDMALDRHTDRTSRGHDLTLLQELQELTPAERIARNCSMVEWIEKLQAAAHATRSDLSKPRE